MRVAIGGYNHETNTFSSEPTTLDSFRMGGVHSGIHSGKEIIDYFYGSRTVLGGFIDASEKYGFDLVPTFYAEAMPSGTVKRDAFDYIEDRLVEGVEKVKNVDGFLVHLHGATVVEGLDDPVGHSLSRMREVVGRKKPIVVVNDLHGNISELMVESADVLIGYKTSPHIDYYERGLEGGKVTASIINGDFKPTAVLKKPPILSAVKKTDTTIPPMSVLLALAQEMERKKDVINVSINGGFCYSDTPHAGLSIVVTTNDDPCLAEESASLLEQVAWAMRRAFVADLPTVDEAIDRVVNAKYHPIILADQGDNVMGGGPGDGTVLIKRLIEVEQDSTGIIRDPEAVEQAIKAGVGKSVELRIGAKTDKLHGTPIVEKGRVRLISEGIFHSQYFSGLKVEMGRTVVFRTGSVDIVITERKAPQVDPLLFRSVGIEPSEKKAVVVKSSHAFTVLFGPIAKEIIYVDTPGVCGNISSLVYRKVRRPIVPLDEM